MHETKVCRRSYCERCANSNDEVWIDKNNGLALRKIGNEVAIKFFEGTDVINTHLTDNTAHSDIRSLIQDLTVRLNALANSDDITLDQLKKIYTSENINWSEIS